MRCMPTFTFVLCDSLALWSLVFGLLENLLVLCARCHPLLLCAIFNLIFAVRFLGLLGATPGFWFIGRNYLLLVLDSSTISYKLNFR